MVTHPTSMRLGFALLIVAWVSLQVGCQIKPTGNNPAANTGTNWTQIYRESFEQVGTTLPRDLFILDGDFRVLHDIPGGPTGKVQGSLELQEGKVGEFGFLFGPTAGPSLENERRVSAYIYSGSRGRLLPTFALGVGGIDGISLWVLPAEKRLAVRFGDETLATTRFDWQSEQGVRLRLTLQRVGETWQVVGDACHGGACTVTLQHPKPSDINASGKVHQARIKTTLKGGPPVGRAMIMLHPLHGKSMQVDGLQVWQKASP